MSMSKVDAADVILTARRASARVGQTFVVDMGRLASMGPFTDHEVDMIMAAVTEIEVHYKVTIDLLRRS
jgi:hypothetical protein